MRVNFLLNAKEKQGHKYIDSERREVRVREKDRLREWDEEEEKIEWEKSKEVLDINNISSTYRISIRLYTAVIVKLSDLFNLFVEK